MVSALKQVQQLVDQVRPQRGLRRAHSAQSSRARACSGAIVACVGG